MMCFMQYLNDYLLETEKVAPMAGLKFNFNS